MRGTQQGSYARFGRQHARALAHHKDVSHSVQQACHPGEAGRHRRRDTWDTGQAVPGVTVLGPPGAMGGYAHRSGGDLPTAAVSERVPG